MKTWIMLLITLVLLQAASTFANQNTARNPCTGPDCIVSKTELR